MSEMSHQACGDLADAGGSDLIFECSEGLCQSPIQMLESLNPTWVRLVRLPSERFQPSPYLSRGMRMPSGESTDRRLINKPLEIRTKESG